MKILITGGAGYIGSLLAHDLIKEGHEISILDNLRYNQMSLERLEYALDNKLNFRELFSKKLEKKEDFKHFKFSNIDTTNWKELKDFFDNNKFDIVFHFAELVGVSLCNQNSEFTKKVNFEGSANVIDLCEKTGSKLVYNSSSSVYGLQKHNNMIDEKGGIPHPTDEYVKNKIAVEKHILSRKNLNFIMFRPATVGGLSLRMRMMLLPHHFTYAAVINKRFTLSNPSHYRALIHVQDMVDVYKMIVRNPEKINNQTYNIGNDSLNLMKSEFLGMIKEIVPDFKIIAQQGFGDIRNLSITSKKLKEEFGFEARKDFKDMIFEFKEIIEKNPKTFDDSENFNSPELWPKLLE